MTTFKISSSRCSFTNTDTNEILIWTSDLFNPAKLEHHFDCISFYRFSFYINFFKSEQMDGYDTLYLVFIYLLSLLYFNTSP